VLKLVSIIIGLLVSSVLLIVAVGYILPVEHVAGRSIALRQKPESVFALISDFKQEPAWRSDVQQVEILPDHDGHVRFREKSARGSITMVVVDSMPPRRMVTEIDGKDLPFGGRWIFEILPDAETCRLNITERGRVYNPLFRFMSRYIIGYTGTMDGYLKSVARKFGESGSPVAGEIAQN
jgi:Polyketide cyclase / dehydrase and lipid transport